MDDRLNNIYIAMIKKTFDGKFDEFKFTEGSNNFIFKQKIQKLSNDEEQYYLLIDVGRFITFYTVRETMYHGKQISKTHHHRCTKSTRFHNANKLQIEWFKGFINKRVDSGDGFNIDINESKDGIVEDIITEKYGINVNFGYYGNRIQIRLNDKYRENIINGAKIQQLFAEIKKEFELFDVMRKI